MYSQLVLHTFCVDAAIIYNASGGEVAFLQLTNDVTKSESYLEVRISRLIISGVRNLAFRGSGI